MAQKPVAATQEKRERAKWHGQSVLHTHSWYLRNAAVVPPILPRYYLGEPSRQGPCMQSLCCCAGFGWRNRMCSLFSTVKPYSHQMCACSFGSRVGTFRQQSSAAAAAFERLMQQASSLLDESDHQVLPCPAHCAPARLAAGSLAPQGRCVATYSALPHREARCRRHVSTVMTGTHMRFTHSLAQGLAGMGMGMSMGMLCAGGHRCG